MRRVKVFLQQDYPKLGFIGDQIEVRGGYARNYLLPRGIAFEASGAHERIVKHKLTAVTAKKVKLRSEAERIVKEMEGMVPEFVLRIGEGGKSFGSITNRDLVKWLDDKGYKLDRSQVLIIEPIRKAGEHQVKVRLHSDVTASLKVRVSAEVPVVAAATEASDKTAKRGRGRSKKNVAEGAEDGEDTAASE